LFDSGLILIALGIVLMIVFRKEKLNTKKREKGSISKCNDEGFSSLSDAVQKALVKSKAKS